jgi:hypothetical protein
VEKGVADKSRTSGKRGDLIEFWHSVLPNRRIPLLFQRFRYDNIDFDALETSGDQLLVGSGYWEVSIAVDFSGGELDSTGCWKCWWRVVVGQQAT